jgi:hypothetical protein
MIGQLQYVYLFTALLWAQTGMCQNRDFINLFRYNLTRTNLKNIRYRLIFIVASKSYYVTKSGNDLNLGTSETTGWLTIQKAASLVTPGSTVYIDPGIYYETVTINVQGNTKDGPIIFTSLMPNKRPVILGKQAKVTSADGTLNLIYMEKKSYLQFANLELTDLKVTECSGVRIVSGGSNIGTYVCLFRGCAINLDRLLP